ncbi:MAG TPA: hypothetical protein VG097_00425, partial [Gemmata sp.]|nr:hypothetical protein [Gemmata sp.]
RARDLLDWSEADEELDKLHDAFRITSNVQFQPSLRREKLPKIKGVEYEFISRGFFNYVHITKPAEFLKHRKTIFRASPITSMLFDRLSMDEAKELVNGGDLGQIRELGFGTDVAPEAISVLGNHRDAVGVHRLELVSVSESFEQIEAIASGFHWTGVKSLDLHPLILEVNRDRDSLLAELLRRPQFRRIQRLIAPRMHLGNATAQTIARVGLTDLRFLDLADNNIENAGAMAISRSRLLPNLRYLDLHFNDFTGEAVTALIATPKLPNLTVLKLGGRYYTILDLDINKSNLDLKPFTKTARGPTLRVLQIDRCNLTEGSLHALAFCPAVQDLCFFSLASCSIADRELRALTAGKGLNRLKILNLSHNHLTVAGMRTLADWPVIAGLQWLDLSGNKIGDEGAKALVNCLYLKKLRHLAITGSGTARLRKHFGKNVVP